jgi:hypothetical protein
MLLLSKFEKEFAGLDFNRIEEEKKETQPNFGKKKN